MSTIERVNMNRWYRSELRRLQERGARRMKQRKYNAALECYEECLELLGDCGSGLVSQWRPGCLLNLAACHLALRNYERAVVLTTQVLSTCPENEKALYRRAKARCEIGELAEARGDLELLHAMNDSQVVAEMLTVVSGALANGKWDKSDPLPSPEGTDDPVSSSGSSAEPSPRAAAGAAGGKGEDRRASRKKSRMAMMRNVGSGDKHIHMMREFSASAPNNATTRAMPMLDASAEFLPPSKSLEWTKGPPRTVAEVVEYKAFMQRRYEIEASRDAMLHRHEPSKTKGSDETNIQRKSQSNWDRRSRLVGPAGDVQEWDFS